MCLLLPALPAAAQLNESFTDGDFTQNPAWTGDAASFQVVAQQLQSNGPAVTGSQIQLVTPSQAVTGTTWEFWANLRLATSSANLADVWLMSEQADLKASTNRGYFVRLGGTADEVSLFRKDASSSTVIINGADGTLGSSTNNLVRVRVTRSPANVWTLERDLTGGRTFTTEGTATDATLTRSQHFGVALVYSSANNRAFLFDDILISDTTPPQLVQASTTSTTQLEVLFNEPVAATVAAGNFRLASGAVPAAATRDAADPALVRLTFGSAFPGGTSTLEVRNVADLYGNVAAGPLTATFSATAPQSQPGPSQLLITEIYADETPGAGGAAATYASEYIEIFNPTAAPLDLAGVRLLKTGTATAAVFPAGATLLPGEYAVVCGSTRIAQFTGFGKVFGLTNFPSLSNGGDELLLRGRDGRQLFAVAYSDAWYRDNVKKEGGWSLEMVDTGRPCVVGADNWAASTDATGGTPARQNSVRANSPDQTAPTLTSATALSATVVRLTFGEKLDSAQAANVALYTLQPATAVQSVTVQGTDFRSVDLTLAAPLPVNQPLTVNVQRATDCLGNASGPIASASFVYFGAAVLPNPQQVLITEIMADEDPAVRLPNFEFIEIYNPTATLLDLGGMRLLKPSLTSAAVFPNGTVLRPGEYAVVCGTSAAAAFTQYFAQNNLSVAVYGLSSFPSLSNGGDQLVLRGRSGRTLFEVTYSDTWYRDNAKRNGGWSLEMVDTSNPCGGMENWTASTNANGGTPGQANAARAVNTDRTAPTLLRAVAVNATTVRLYFNEKLDSAAVSSLALYTLQPVTGILRAAAVSPDFRSVNLTLATPLPANQPITVSMQRATDCVGNASGAFTSATFALPVPAAAGDVVINEVLFNPRSGGVDFVELLNRSTKYVDLQGADLGRETGTGTDFSAISTEPLVLAPGGLLVLTTNPAIVQSQYPTSNDPTAFLTMSSLPSYPDDAGTVLLRNGQQVVLDRFTYDQDMHLALLDTRDGVSLERIRPEGPSVASNFHSAAGSVGYATPGRRNSQFLAEAVGNQQFQVDPEIFTPDEDGDRDFTTLTYRLDQSGYAASVSVYDTQGRMVRRLVRNETLATTGFFQWDGLTDQGRKAGLGHYLLHIELFRPNGGQKREYKKTVVLGARL
ncbi:lamin tail domain-containing protein [Hymenobacter koreensis]|uniref:Lamin tail domain-containing protein n=1 Tax=Hymenobacter koreensis TaxID=1084523 RepID=A0ABP8IX10_9BACT